jgi:nucleotide-binding universal stress UspA family protein
LYVDRSASGATGELEAELDRVRRDAGSWAGVAVAGVTIRSDDIASAIADRARDERADLIVLGTRGLGLDAVGRLGSVSEAVTRRVDVPVLLVPPAVWTALREEWPR